MIARMSLGALAVMLIATAADAAPVRPGMALPAQAASAQTAPAASGAAQPEAAQEGQSVPGPARPRVRRKNSFFGIPLAFLAVGGGAGVGAAVLASTSSPQ